MALFGRYHPTRGREEAQSPSAMKAALGPHLNSLNLTQSVGCRPEAVAWFGRYHPTMGREEAQSPSALKTALGRTSYPLPKVWVSKSREAVA